MIRGNVSQEKDFQQHQISTVPKNKQFKKKEQRKMRKMQRRSSYLSSEDVTKRMLDLCEIVFDEFWYSFASRLQTSENSEVARLLESILPIRKNI